MPGIWISVTAFLDDFDLFIGGQEISQPLARQGLIVGDKCF
jgi:hypothetical protein